MEQFDPLATAIELDNLTHTWWKGDKEALEKYRAVYRSALLNGFKVIKHQNGIVKHKLVECKTMSQVDINGRQFLGKSKTKLASMLIYDGRTKGMKFPKGCCTTRAMSYVLKNLKFEDIYAKQLKLGGKRHWNCTSTISKMMAKYGDYSLIDITQIPKCKHNRSEASIAARLFSIKSPMAVETSSHMAAIDNSFKVPCVVDFWDSRNHKVEYLYVKRKEAERAIRILNEF